MKRTFTRQRITRAAATLAAPRRALVLALTLIAALTVQTAWADSYPAYITDVVLAGGTETEAQSVKNSSTYSGYTWCSTSLNDGTSGDVIYIGYKKGSRANVNGGYITDFIIIDAGTGTEGHNPPYSLTFQGRTYYRCPAAGGDYFVNSNHGNLTSQAANGWNMYLYYTKDNFSDKRAVNGITIYSVGDINEHKSGAINCYYKDGTLHEEEISLNKGVSKTPYVYMHINTVTKTNRPSADPVMASGLTYNGSAKQLIATGATLASGTMYYRLGTSGSFTSTMADVKATTAGTHTVYYYAGANSYSNQSDTHSATVSIAKSPNSGVTVSCADVVDGNAPAPQLGGTNLSTGAVTYQYSTTQNGTYTTTVPTDFGKYWVKATIAGDDNCYAYTTAAASFCILADANDLWNVKGGANGTVGHPFIISNPSQLDLLASKVNGGTDYSGKYFELGANITYDGTTNNYTPIGTENAQDNAFTGHFDGKGHTVSGINIDTYAQWYKGLFGRIGSTAEVKNVTLSDATITGYQYTGGIVGYNNGGTVENCHVLSTVTVLGTIFSAVYHGGIVGSNGGTVRGCTSAATVSYQSATYNMSYYGGIVGYNSGTIEDCLVYGGSVRGTFRVGAVVGYNSGTLTNNHYSGVTLNGSEAGLNAGVGDGSQDGTSYICAIIPYEGVALSIPSVSATTEYPYNGLKIYSTGMSYNGQYYNYIENTDANISGNVTFTATYSGSVPEDYAHSGFGYTSNASSTDVPTDWAATDGSATCTLSTNVAMNYYIAPTFRLAVWGTGDGTQGNPYVITTVRGMNELASKVNSGEGDLGGKYFELGADIEYDYTGLGENESNYTAIGTGSGKYFKGKFDGKGHTVSGIRIYMDGTNNQGLFGKITEYAEVKNVTLSDARITGQHYVGGIVGWNSYGTIENCHVLSAVTIGGTVYPGGITGYNEGTVRGCTSAASVSGTTIVGGIAGSTDGTVEDCLVLGGSSSGTTRYGVVVGFNSGTLTNNYHTIYGMGAVEGSDQDGARFAVATGTKPGTFGDATATYGTGTYTGIKAYGTNGLEYGGKYYWHDANLMELADRNEDNSSVIVANEGQTCNVVLKDRTLLKNGDWNTLCLPFSLTAEQIAASPLAGATIKELLSTSNLDGEGKLTLNFQDATAITAGKPYMVKWDPALPTDLTNPVFDNVTIDNTENNVSFSGGSFKGTYAPLEITDANRNEVLLLATGNKLGYAKTDRTVANGKALGTCRAYFEIPTTTGAPAINSYELNFGEGTATSISEELRVKSEEFATATGWYTLDGRRLQGKPAQKGVYIQNGKKVIIK